MQKKSTLVLGSSGRIGSALTEHFEKHREVIAFRRSELDFSFLESLEKTLRSLSFDCLVNCAAYTRVDDCEEHEADAYRANCEAPALLARICAEKGAKFVHFSTDYVFDGERPDQTPYCESDAPNPISAYGRSKLAGEEAILAEAPESLIIRTSWVFGLQRPSFPEWILSRAIDRGAPLEVVGDKWANPARAEDIPVLLDQILSHSPEAHGLYHLVNSEYCSWSDYARFILERAAHYGIPVQTTEVEEIPLQSLTAFRAPRPPFSALSTRKFQDLTGIVPTPWQEAVDAHLELISSRYAT